MKNCGLNFPKTSDFITHTDVIRRFIESPLRITIIDYVSAEDARSVAMLFRMYIDEHEYNNVRVIQRSNDVIIYKERKKNGNRRT